MPEVCIATLQPSAFDFATWRRCQFQGTQEINLACRLMVCLLGVLRRVLDIVSLASIIINRHSLGYKVRIIYLDARLTILDPRKHRRTLGQDALERVAPGI